MFYVDNGTGIETMPKIANKQSNVTTWFTEGDNANAPSYPGQDWFNMVQAELLNTLTVAGVTPQKGQHDQLAGIISTLINGVKAAQNTANQALIIGKIEFMPFRTNQLPSGWHFANGDAYELSTDIGKALQSLSSNYKLDWGIVTTTATITLPNLFAGDGRGYFMRAVDGKKRQVGSEEGDASRKISGGLPVGDEYAGVFHPNIPVGATNGAVSITFSGNKNSTYSIGNSGAWAFWDFDSSRVVPTASENRPLNIGMTPAIYLGV